MMWTLPTVVVWSQWCGEWSRSGIRAPTKNTVLQRIIAAWRVCSHLDYMGPHFARDSVALLFVRDFTSGRRPREQKHRSGKFTIAICRKGKLVLKKKKEKEAKITSSTWNFFTLPDFSMSGRMRTATTCIVTRWSPLNRCSISHGCTTGVRQFWKPTNRLR